MAAAADSGNRSTSKVDILVGRKLRAARLESGMSQELVALRVGISFQQLQKYEKGVNRVAVGRLMQISQILNKSIGWFFDVSSEDLPPNTDFDTEIWRTLATHEGMEFLTRFSRIESPEVRRRVLAFIVTLIDVDPDAAPHALRDNQPDAGVKSKPKAKQ